MEGELLAYTIEAVSSQEDRQETDRFSKDYINGVGWISSKACDYPQEIILRLQDVAQVTAIQILSHHAYIPSKTEIKIGQPRNKKDHDPSPKHAKWTHLGAAVFKDNADRKHKQRERKTIYVNAKGLFLKMLFYENYENELNPSNQVGILSIKIYGHGGDEAPAAPKQKPVEMEDDEYVERAIRRYEEERSDSEHEPEPKARPKSGRASSRDKTTAKPPSAKKATKAAQQQDSVDDFDMGFKVDLKAHKALIKLLRDKKEEAVNKEKYLDARNIKKMIQQLEEKEKEMNYLNFQRTEAITAEDYERAHECKEQFDQIKENAIKELPHIEKYLTVEERRKFLA